MSSMKSSVIFLSLFCLAACGVSKNLRSSQGDDSSVKTEGNVVNPVDQESVQRRGYLNIIRGIYAPEHPKFEPLGAPLLGETSISVAHCEAVVKRLDLGDASGIVVPMDFGDICESGDSLTGTDHSICMIDLKNYPRLKNQIKEIVFDSHDHVVGYNQENVNGSFVDFRMKTAEGYMVEHHYDRHSLYTKILGGNYEMTISQDSKGTKSVNHGALIKTLTYHLNSGETLDVLEVSQLVQKVEQADCSMTVRRGNQTIYTDHLPLRCFPTQTPTANM